MRLGPLGLHARRQCGPTAGSSRPARRPSPTSACLRDSTEPRPITNFEPCAPLYSRPLLSAVPSRMPRWESRPASSAWCTRSGCARLAAGADAQLAGDLAELAEQVLPLAHPQVVEVLAAAQLAELVAAQLLLPLAQVVPQLDEAMKSKSLPVDGEAAVHLVGRLRAARPGVRAGPGSTAPRRSPSPRARSRAGRPRAPSGPGAGRPAGGPAARPTLVSRRSVGRCVPLPAGSQRAELVEQRVAVADRAAGRAARGTGTRRRRRARARSSAG